MYVRKYGHPAEEEKEKEIQIPENYAGNAFENPEESNSNQDQIPSAEEHEITALPPLHGIAKSFSSDTLLLLLAFLLMGGEEGEELSGILIFLMLL